MPETSEHTKPSAATSTSSEMFSFKLTCDWFEEVYGHGWKRKLANIAGVPESNVHSWIKAGRWPSWFQRSFKLLVQISRLRRSERLFAKQVRDYQQVGQIVEDGDGFAVYRSENGIGKLVARGIPDLEVAREIAALPRLKSMSADLSSMLTDVLENQVVPEDWFTDEEKGVVAEVSDWNTPPALSVEKVGVEIEDIDEAFEVLTTEVLAETQ